MLYHLLTANYLLTVAFGSWFAAQVCKTLLNLYHTRSFSFERLFGAGGMPSAHSALVCSTVIAMAKKTGPSSPVFALSVILAAVVMYDAMGVRRSAGEQAKILNRLMSSWMDEDAQEEPQNEKRLKELVGHTPFEVLSGALLGILIGMLIPVF